VILQTHLLAEDGEDDHDAQPADIGEEMKQVQDIQVAPLHSPPLAGLCDPVTVTSDRVA
jgi:hypothetical protein